MLSLTLVLFLAYLLLLGYYTYQWNQIAIFHTSDTKEYRRFSILIPVRNEENNIRLCLEAIKKQRYPKDRIEVIVIDDFSQDNTAEIVRQFPDTKLISKNSATDRPGKKAAIEIGVGSALHEWIITTDADCIAGPDWITTLNAYLDEKELVCLVGPVSVEISRKNLLQYLQRYDTLMLQGITGAAIQSGIHTLGNGANLCYRAESFFEVHGYHKNHSMASGDDVFLIESFMQRYPKSVHFLKSSEALVYTNAVSDWKTFWQQRLRWVSKANAYQQLPLQIAQWITGLFNLALLIQSVHCLFLPDEWKTTLAIWICKSLIEWPLVSSVSHCYRVKPSILLYSLLQPIHLLYLVAIGLFGRNKRYEWKGRTVH